MNEQKRPNKNCPNCESQNEWRYVEDGLPEKEGEYLVQCQNGKMRVVKLVQGSPSDDKFFRFPYLEHWHGDVIAWRELPAPCKPIEAAREK